MGRVSSRSPPQRGALRTWGEGTAPPAPRRPDWSQEMGLVGGAWSRASPKTRKSKTRRRGPRGPGAGLQGAAPRCPPPRHALTSARLPRRGRPRRPGRSEGARRSPPPNPSPSPSPASPLPGGPLPPVAPPPLCGGRCCPGDGAAPPRPAPRDALVPARPSAPPQTAGAAAAA